MNVNGHLKETLAGAMSPCTTAWAQCHLRLCFGATGCQADDEYGSSSPLTCSIHNYEDKTKSKKGGMLHNVACSSLILFIPHCLGQGAMFINYLFLKMYELIGRGLKKM